MKEYSETETIIHEKYIHDCEMFDLLNPDTYQHSLYMHGKALSGRVYQYPDGSISMDNEEYGIRVLFCPYCGHNLQTDAPPQ